MANKSSYEKDGIVEDKSLLTIDQALQMVNIGRTSLYRLMNEGVIASVSIGRSRRIPRAALEAWIDSLAKA